MIIAVGLSHQGSLKINQRGQRNETRAVRVQEAGRREEEVRRQEPVVQRHLVEVIGPRP